MKKLLLSASAAILAVSAFAGVDPAVYSDVNDLKCTNVWLKSRFVDDTEFSSLAIATAKSRTACLYDGVVYVGNSMNDDPSIVTSDGKPDDCCAIYKFDAKTGEQKGILKVAVDGVRLQGLLCANQVGVDNFGNLWVAGYSASMASNYKIYSVDKETGAAVLQASLPRDVDGRIDYCDLVGDVTRVNAKALVMAAAATPATSLLVYRWVSEQGSTAPDAWEGGWEGDNSFNMSAAYPAAQTAWGTAPTVTIVVGENEEAYNGALFYIDGFTTYPTLYNDNGAILDSFENAPDLAPAAAGTNGVTELQIAGKNFIAYSLGQYDGSNKCQMNISELGDNMMFQGMSKYWTLPEAGLGQTSDTGTRVHSISREYIKEDGVNVGANVLTYKCMNGFGVYTVGKSSGVEGSFADDAAQITVKGDVISVSAEASEIAIFNIAGQQVAKVMNATEIAAPAAGAYIVKAVVNGSPVVKKIVL